MVWNGEADGPGGGFLDETYNDTTTTSEDADSLKRINYITPLMIGHLVENYPDKLKVWKRPVNVVRLVGWVRKFEETTTKATYDVVDETGSVAAFLWLHGKQAKRLVSVTNGSYVQVTGTPRMLNGTLHILILKIKQLTSLSHVLHHLMEVTFLADCGEELFSENRENKNPNLMETTDAAIVDSKNFHNMNVDQVAVLNVIRMHEDDVLGVEKKDLIKQLPARLRTELDSIIAFLVSEGHVYTTSTDDHFKAT